VENIEGDHLVHLCDAIVGANADLLVCMITCCGYLMGGQNCIKLLVCTCIFIYLYIYIYIYIYKVF
jgi:hypothetical protein